MPLVKDFRKFAFLPRRVDRCGRNVGSKVYWKLYSIENAVRVIINSVLSKQISQQWWTEAVSPNVVNKAQKRRARYAAKPKHANPGSHDIYLIDLFDLTEILRINSNLFSPIIPETDQFLVVLESMRVSRNIIGHMNFPNAYDRNAVDTAYKELPAILARLAAGNVPISVP
ncbi:MAG TPA: hypothetical protein VN861_08095 [Candidatus Acidoferrales bacterium]|nr:hypothetical protein [Candidatus Acidoferrales bacterium]